jgi:hypothetical protein
MLFSSGIRIACPQHVCALLLLALLAGHASAEPAVTPDDEITLGDEPLDLSTPLVDSLGKPLLDVTGKTPKRTPPAASLERPLETKLGVNYRQAPIPNAEFQPDPFIRNGFQGTGASPDSTGVAWAHVTAPQLPFGWDSVTIDSQLDPLDEQGKVSGTLSRSLALGDEIAVTLRNGYSTERSFSHGDGAHWATNQSLRLRLLPTDTTLSLDASLSSGADRWLRTLSAEQKLFGGPFSLSGAVSETSNGDLAKSLKAGFKQNW